MRTVQRVVMLLDAAALAHAQQVVYGSMSPTPQYAWPLLAEALGTEVWVKHENATPTGAFKVRGGLVYVDRLVRERSHVRGIVSATRGNHGQSFAFAGRRHGLPVVIVVPHHNSPEKNDAMRSFGAELIVHGADFQEAREFSVGLADERGYEAVPVVPPRSRGRGGHLRQGVVRCRGRTRRGVRADRSRIRGLRTHRRA
jgi:threonine dehydratase